MEGPDITVVGSGIVGAAIAMRLRELRPSLSVKLVDKEASVGAHQTGHNSGVIHSGIYYKPDSLKARNCRRGYDLLLEFLAEESIPHDICGKIIVATNDAEQLRLKGLKERGAQNGLQGLRLLNPEEMQQIEPHVAGIQGLHVPQAGIVNYKTVNERYVDRFKRGGGIVELSCAVENLAKTGKHQVRLSTNKGAWTSRYVISAAGLYSDRLARMTTPKLDLRIVPFRGEYYSMSRTDLVRHLIYPVPDPAFPFLGVHFTRMIGGGIEAGPNAVLALHREGYRWSKFSSLDLWETLSWPGFRKVARKHWRTGLFEVYRSLSKQAFVRALQKLVPDVRSTDLAPAGAGVRAQACHRVDGLLDDFFVQEEDNVVHVCNAPSPAATSSLAIAETIAENLVKRIT